MIQLSFVGFVVTSGLRLYYDKPREYDAGMLMTGISVRGSILIPPKQEKWILSGGCSSNCSSVSNFILNPRNQFIFANFHDCQVHETNLQSSGTNKIFHGGRWGGGGGFARRQKTYSILAKKYIGAEQLNSFKLHLLLSISQKLTKIS